MQTKNYLRKTLALVMAFLMIVTMMPVNLMAAEPLADWDESTTDSEFWPTPEGVTYDDRGLSTSPWPGYDIGFDGFSTDGEGRTVINLKLMAYSTANPNTVTAKYNYQYAQFKFSPELEKMIDFDKTFVGTLRYQNEPDKSTNNDRIKFSNSTPSQKGVYQVMMQQLLEGGTYASRVWNLPIKIVLQGKYTLNDINKDYLIQSRFLNFSQNMYYARINRKVTDDAAMKLNGYNAYTFSTIVPGKSSVRKGEIANRATYNDANNLGNSQQPPLFTQRTVIANYDEETSKLYIFHGALKQASSYNTLDNGNIGYRVSFDSRFKKYLKTDPDTGAVGYVSIRDGSLKSYSTTKTAFLKDTDANTIGNTTVFQLGTNNFQNTEGITKKTVVNNNINQVYLHSAATLANLFTIAVFDIDQDMLMKESFTDPNKVIESFAVRTSFVLDTQDTDFNNVQTNGWSKYSYTVPNNITIPANGKITITTDKLFGSSLFGVDAFGDNYITKAKQLLVNIGGDEGMTYLMPSQTGEFRGLTVVKNNQKQREFEIPFREGQTLKAGQTIDVYIPMDVRKEGKRFLTDNAVNLIFKDNTGAEIATEKITSDQITKVKPARTLENGDKLTGVIFDRTLMPVIDEIFTDSTEYRGHSLYPESKVIGLGIDGAKKETVFVGTIEDPVKLNGKTYNYAYKFTNTNFAGPLKKDLPIRFFNQDIGRLPSETVTEQVQAKVRFDLNGYTSKIDGYEWIDKIAPLNKQHLYKYVDEQDPKHPTDPNKTIRKFVVNKDYIPSGFAKLDKAGDLVGAEQLRVDNKNTVEVEQVLTDSEQRITRLNRKVINYIDHNGMPYDINSSDTKIKDEQVKKLLMRQYPISEEVNLPNAKKIIGWTTVKLEDKKDSQGKVITAEEQYYELLNAKVSKKIRDVKTWQKVDDDEASFKKNPSIKRDIYIFDEKSPLDTGRTVYAVYGGLSIVLHSGITSGGEEITVRLPITQADLDETDKALAPIDAKASATTIVKKLPKAPYSSEKVDIDDQYVDERLKSFTKDKHTFIGWTHLKDQASLRVGENNLRIEQLLNGEANNKKILKKTEALKHLLDDDKKSTVPNGFDFAFSSKDITPTGKYSPSGNGIQSRDLLLKNIDEIHLYAVYRPYFKVTVNPKYATVDMSDYDETQKNMENTYIM